MKVLMFGWEFPPHISGGLGTACYGLTRGLSIFDDLEILFVIPKAQGDEDKDVARIIGAGDVVVKKRKYSFTEKWSEETSTTTKQQADITEIEQITTVKKHSTKVEQMSEKEITYFEVASLLTPYLSPEQFEQIVLEKEKRGEKFASYADAFSYITKKREEKFVTTEEQNIEKHVETENEEEIIFGKFKFSGKYGKDLMTEVANYAYVAETIARENDFDIIHAHDWLTYAAGVAAKRITGKPLVIHVHATEFDRTGENINQQVYDIERMGMLYADKIIAVSNLTRNTIISRYGIAPEKVVTVYNAVEPLKEEKKKYKKNLDEKIVTFLGRITYQKGPEYFIEAAKKVLDREKNVRFVMAGSGDMLRKMIRRVAQLRMSSRFHFTDFLKGEDVDRMFGMSDVYVMPSVSEPFGISPLEAMRSNVPVIISKQSGVAEILQHALKIDFWDVDAMADAIHGLLKYESLSKMFIRYGKEEVNSLKWENAAANVKKVYDDTIAEFNKNLNVI